MANSKVPSGLSAIITKVADALKVDMVDYRVEDACGKGSSFIGGIYKVFIRGTKDGQKVKYEVVIKWIPSLEKRRYFSGAYRREILVYEKIAPALLHIQRSKGFVEGLRMKFIRTILTGENVDNEFLAVHSLSAGYKMMDGRTKPNLEHVTLIFKELAKLHGLSFILQKENPDKFGLFQRECSIDVQYADPSLAPKYMRYYYDASVNVIRDPIAKEKLEKLAPDFFLVLNKCTIPADYSCLCHGDCWTNNILFKYNKQKPIDICLIDYQLMRYASPVTDISFYISMSTDRGLRSKHYTRLLDIYYGTLTAVLRQGSLDVNEVYPREIFEQHLRKYSVLGLVEALIALKIITGSPEEALNMSEMNEKITHVPTVNEEKESLYIDRVNGVVDDFFSNGYSLNEVLGRNEL